MGSPRTARPVRLFCSIISGDRDTIRRTRQRLTRVFGPLALESPIMPFDHTLYYEAEMGADLQNEFLLFENPIGPDALVDLKINTNELEREFSRQILSVARPVNIDPGYLDHTKLVLATTKDRPHRIYLSHGIYAEVTLHFQSGAWQHSAWTYASYRTPEAIEFMNAARALALRDFTDQPLTVEPPNPARESPRPIPLSEPGIVPEPPPSSGVSGIEPYPLGDILPDEEPH